MRTTTSSSVALAAVTVALSVAGPARAAQKTAPLAPARPSAATSLALPTGARPSTPPLSPAVADTSWRLGPGLGFEFGVGDQKYTAMKIRIDAELPLRQLSPVATLSFLTSLGMAHPSGDESFPVVVDPFFGVVETATLEWDANVFELVPAARLTYAANPRLSLFADGGLGLLYTVAHVYVPPTAAGLSVPELVGDGIGGVVRLAGGLVFAPSPALRIAIEAVGLHIRFGDGPGTAFSLVASISHRL